MVKISLPMLLAVCVALGGCAFQHRAQPAHPQVLALGPTSIGPEVSLLSGGSSVFVVYADRESATLRLVELPVDADLPKAAPAASVIDRIAEAPPLSAAFGEQAAVTHDDLLSVLYLDQRAEDRRIMKIASRPLAGGPWTVDAIDDPGDPVAALAAGAGTMELVWSTNALLVRPWPGSQTELSLCAPFTADGAASVFGSGATDRRGFTVWDQDRKILRLARWNGVSYEMDVVPGAAKVHSTTAAADGTIAVLSWDPAAHRLYLLERKPGSATFERTTVTIADDVNAVQLLSADPGYVVLFDESRSGGAGRREHRLELIAPGRPHGSKPGRYEELTLLSAEEPIVSLKAILTPHSLYALVFQGGLKLLRLPRDQMPDQRAGAGLAGLSSR